MWMLRHLGAVAESVTPQGYRVQALTATSIPGGIKLTVAFWCPVPADVILSATLNGSGGDSPAPVYAWHDGEGRQVEDIVIKGRCYLPGASVVVNSYLAAGQAAVPLVCDINTLRVT